MYHGFYRIILEFSRPRQAHIQYRLPGTFIPCGLRLTLHAPDFLLPAKYTASINLMTIHIKTPDRLRDREFFVLDQGPCH